MMSYGARIHCGDRGLASFSKSKSVFGEIVTPVRFVKGPVGPLTTTSSELKEFLLKP